MAAGASYVVEEETGTGYDYLDPVPPSLECPICRQSLQNPVLTPCDHLFCHACLSRALELHPTCPIDRTRIQEAECRRPPRVVAELLDDLRVRCEECETEMRRGDWEAHAERCRRRRETEADVAERMSDTPLVPNAAVDSCDVTSLSLLRTSDADERRSSPCTDDASPCVYCSLPILSSSRPSHLLTCPLIPVPCPYAAFGCPFRYPRSSLPVEHLDSGECAYEPLKEGLEKAREKWETAQGENWELKQRVGKLEGVVETLVAELQAVKASLGDFYFPSCTASPATAPSLSTTLHSLSTAQTSLSTSLSTLSHSHTAQLSTASHFGEELAAVRQGVGALRMQMGGVMMDLQSLYAGGGAGLGGYGAGLELRRPGLRPMRTSSSEGEEGGAAGVAGGDGSSGSSSDEEGQAYPSPAYIGLRGVGSYPFPLAFSPMHLPLPLPLGMRPVFPTSASPGHLPSGGIGDYSDGFEASPGAMGIQVGGRTVGGRGMGFTPPGGGGRGRGGVKL
ncbi:hypothetical protein JCM11251_004684 [Rhodosporidiobolus azoricus]